MKILMLGWELPPHNSGGLGVACENLAKALVAEGAEVEFVLPYRAEHPGIDFMKLIPATNLEPLMRYGWGAYAGPDVMDFAGVSECEARGGGFECMREVQRAYIEFVRGYLARAVADGKRPDVVHAHDWLTLEAGMVAKQEFGIPLVAHVHATEYDRSGMMGGNSVVHRIEREGLTVADKVIAVSDATRHLINRVYGIPLDKIEVAYNALPEDFVSENYHYDEGVFPYLMSLKTQGYNIVTTVGRFTIQKGLTHLLHAAQMALQKNPKLMFLFAGDGEERNELVRLAAEYGVAENVIFTGFVRGKMLRDVYSVSDIFVMSSVSEPFGLTALEAAHHGAVLILTKQSGVAEVIRSALSYDFWDDNKLAAQIVDVSTNEVLKESLRKDITREYRRISWRDAARKCLMAYVRIWRQR